VVSAGSRKNSGNVSRGFGRPQRYNRFSEARNRPCYQRCNHSTCLSPSGWLARSCALSWRGRRQHALNGKMPLPGGDKSRDAGLDARAQHAARWTARAHDLPALRQSPRQCDFRSAVSRHACARVIRVRWYAPWRAPILILSRAWGGPKRIAAKRLGIVRPGP
jgi:hypothetical protein